VELIAGGLVGLFAGFVAGRITERTRRTRVDYVTSRKAIPGLKRVAWGNLEKAIRTWAVVAFLVAAVVFYLVKTPK
jgi:hypothetical protein